MGDAACMLPSVLQMDEDSLHARAMFDLGEKEGAFTTHFTRVALHHRQVGTDGRGQVGLVDDEKIGLRDARAALAREFVAPGVMMPARLEGVAGRFVVFLIFQVRQIVLRGGAGRADAANQLAFLGMRMSKAHQLNPANDGTSRPCHSLSRLAGRGVYGTITR